MKSVKLFVFVLMLSVLNACAANVPVVQNDQFSNTIKIDGVRDLQNPFGGPSYYWFLRSWVDKKTFAATHQLYVHVSYFWGWKFFETAADDQAKALPFVSIDKNVDDCSGMTCSYDETFGASIGDSDLKKSAQTGFQVKFSAHDGSSIIVTVSPQQIQQQLGTIELATHPDKAAQIQAFAQTPYASDPDSMPKAEALPKGSVKLGVHVGPLTAAAASGLGMDEPHGVMAVIVDTGLPASEAGLRPGDILLEYNGTAVNSVADLASQIAQASPGKHFTLKVLRGGQSLTLEGRYPGRK